MSFRISLFVQAISGLVGREVAIHSIIPVPRNADQFVVASRSNTVAIMNTQGQVSSFAQTVWATFFGRMRVFGF